jgi:peptidoglycan/LPS O-acetylase OafA/YrhL
MKSTFSRKKSGYIPTLDGWRAVAILGVMLFHGGALFSHGSRLEDLRLMGEDGVRLFFAISGILICTRLLDEEAERGSFSLKGFYIRRVFRIQPAAFVFLLALVLLAAVGTIPFYGEGWWTSLLSSRNFVLAHSANNGAWYTAHFWSLAIEEQFYLILPGLLLLLRNRHRIRWFAAMTLVSIAWYEYLNGGKPSAHHQLRTESEMCWLFLPALLALLMRRPAFRAQCVKYLQPVPMLLVVCAILGAMVFHVRHIQHFWLPTFSFLVFATILHPASFVSRLLELSFMRWIGRISYSIYLWQQLFCVSELPPVPVGRPLVWLQMHPQNYIVPFVFAVLSYLYVEKPFIRIGHRLAPPVSAGHVDLETAPEKAV